MLDLKVCLKLRFCLLQSIFSRFSQGGVLWGYVNPTFLLLREKGSKRSVTVRSRDRVS